MAKFTGVKVVLTASATEMSEFQGGPLMDFVPIISTGRYPFRLKSKIHLSAGKAEERRAKYAPYGLRKVEALLLENGFSESDIIVVHPKDLERVVGPETKVVGISSMDPTGKGYVDRTYSSILGNRVSLNATEVQKLLNHPSIKKFKPSIILGGYGSWQLERERNKFGTQVDCVLIGDGSEAITQVFEKAVKGLPLPQIVNSQESLPNSDPIILPSIKHAATYGTVQISKGCGRNCQFCTPTMQKLYDVPLERILREAEVNIAEDLDYL
jgi:radical SAM superfamily enzyme YgiQ (UPF0313 family)